MQTIEQFAKARGFTVPQVRSWIQRYRLPVRMIGRRCYIVQADFDAWLDECKVIHGREAAPNQVIIPGRAAGKIRKVY